MGEALPGETVGLSIDQIIFRRPNEKKVWNSDSRNLAFFDPSLFEN